MTVCSMMGVTTVTGTETQSKIASGASGTLVQSTGTGTLCNFTTATYPSTVGASGTVLISDGTNYISSTLSNFSAILSASTASNKTGNGTSYTLICDTELFDLGANYNNGTGIFTAPITGKYAFSARLAWNGVVGQNSSALYISTSNRQYQTTYAAVVFTLLRQNASEICDMDAGDVASLFAVGTGQGADTVGFIGSGSNAVTYFAGHLIL